VFHSLELVVHTVPLMNILVDVVPKVQEEVVAMQYEVIPQVVDLDRWASQ